MEKNTIIVPRGFRYISQWNEFRLENFPHILDKQIPGCGFTEYCLTNEEDLVLCSPRKILLQNKYDQHSNDVFLVINNFTEEISPDKDLSKKVPDHFPIPEEIDETKKEFSFLKLKKDLREYLIDRKIRNKRCKVLVTYDSFGLIKDVLEELGYLHEFRIIIDEFQSIFVDSRFKSNTEIKFVKELQGLNRVCYVSATPMIDKYLEMIPEFRDLPFYELDWISDQPNRVLKPKLTIRFSKSVFDSAKGIIEKYRNHDFETKYVKESNEEVVAVQSKEAVIYVNSVNNIITIIKHSGLRPEEVNILCSNTTANVLKIKSKLGQKFEIGRVPLKGEPHKMFTFCTRTVYLGADFYSTNARTFIISDANVETLAVDISLDLPQIMGRQRLEENPWKNEATFYYKSIVSKKKVSLNVFESQIEEKDKFTEKIINLHSKGTSEEMSALVKMITDRVESLNYKNDYLAVKTEVVDGNLIKVPVFNNLVRISELRAFEIQQVDYANRFNVFSRINDIVGLSKSNSEVMHFLEYYQELPKLYDKLKFLCDLDKEGLLTDEILLQITEKHFQEYFNILGATRIRALGYDITKLNKELGVLSFDRDLLFHKIYKAFEVGNRYTLSQIKSLLSSIYQEVGYNKAPVATDLGDWFEIRSIRINIKLPNDEYKRDRGYEILSKKKET